MERDSSKGLTTVVGGGRGSESVLKALALSTPLEEIHFISTTSDRKGNSRMWIDMLNAISWGDLRRGSGATCINSDFCTFKEHRFPEGSGKLHGLTVRELVIRAGQEVFSGADDESILRRILQVPIEDPDVSQLMSFVFEDGSHNLDGVCVGNALLAVPEYLTGDPNKATKIYQRLFGIRGELIPVSLQRGMITIDLRKSSDPNYQVILEGEDQIDEMTDHPLYDHESFVSRFYHKYDIPLNPRAQSSLLSSKRIILPAGSPYSSVLTPCITPEFDATVKSSNAEGEVVVGIMGRPGEENHLRRASLHLKEIKNYVPSLKVVRVYVNDHTEYDYLDRSVQANYSAEKKSPVVADLEECQKVYPEAEIVVADLAAVDPIYGWIGHDPVKLNTAMQKAKIPA